MGGRAPFEFPQLVMRSDREMANPVLPCPVVVQSSNESSDAATERGVIVLRGILSQSGDPSLAAGVLEGEPRCYISGASAAVTASSTKCRR
jgi:hypothetical protein